LLIGDFLCFAGTNCCDLEKVFFLLGINFCDFQEVAFYMELKRCRCLSTINRIQVNNMQLINGVPSDDPFL